MTETLWRPGTDFPTALADAAALTDTALDKLLSVPPGLEALAASAAAHVGALMAA